MNPSAAPAAGESEWTRGWRIVLGCAIASGTGIVLLFFTFNMMVLPLAAELGVSRGEIGSIQALVVTGALGSIVIGRAADRWGFRATYLASAALTVATMLIVVRFGQTLTHIAIGVATLGFLGVGTAALVTTRPIGAHFHRYRGRALGLVATGVSITAIAAPLLLAPVIETYGWRGGFVTLAALMALVGMPAVLFVVPRGAGGAISAAGNRKGSDWSFLKTRDFQLMAASIVFMGLATTGFVGQLSPIVQAEGFDAEIGALAVSVFVAGQFVGRLGGGWLLDTFKPQTVGLVFTIVPGAGFLLLLGTDRAVAEGLALPTGWHANHRVRYAHAKARLVDGLAAAGFAVLPASGTWFVTIDLAESDLPADDEAVSQALIEQAGVASIPVSAFYAEHAERGFLRLCFAKDDATLDEAVRRLTTYRQQAGGA